jgi:multidrug efflux pump subunit AcrA (membrane-fusion protein)
MKKKIVIAVGIGIVLLVAGAAAFWPFSNRGILRLPGVVEIQEVRLGSKVGGRVEKVHVLEGDLVEKNQKLITFEAPELQNQKLQTEARLRSAQAEYERAMNGPRLEEVETAKAAKESAYARWQRAEAGYRPEEVQQAKSDLAAAKADAEQAEQEWKRVADLFEKKAAAKSDLDIALGMRDRTRGHFESARAKEAMMKIGFRKEDRDEAWQEFKKTEAQYELLRKGTRHEEKDMAKAKVDELEAILEAIGINLKETTVLVPENLGRATVEVIAVRPGDLVTANQPIVRVLRVEDLWVKVYVPETKYGLIQLNQQVDVTVDSHPGKIFKGVVVQKSNIAEFTPRNVQSVDERRHQVFGVKIRVSNPDGVFNAGMAAEVSIPVR